MDKSRPVSLAGLVMLANAANDAAEQKQCSITTGGPNPFLLRQLFVVLPSLVCVELTPVRVFFVLYGDERVSPPLVTAASLDGVRNYCVICGTGMACFE